MAKSPSQEDFDVGTADPAETAGLNLATLGGVPSASNERDDIGENRPADEESETPTRDVEMTPSSGEHASNRVAQPRASKAFVLAHASTILDDIKRMNGIVAAAVGSTSEAQNRSNDTDATQSAGAGENHCGVVDGCTADQTNELTSKNDDMMELVDNDKEGEDKWDPSSWDDEWDAALGSFNKPEKFQRKCRRQVQDVVRRPSPVVSSVSPLSPDFTTAKTTVTGVGTATASAVGPVLATGRDSPDGGSVLSNCSTRRLRPSCSMANAVVSGAGGGKVRPEPASLQSFGGRVLPRGTFGSAAGRTTFGARKETPAKKRETTPGVDGVAGGEIAEVPAPSGASDSETTVRAKRLRSRSETTVSGKAVLSGHRRSAASNRQSGATARDSSVIRTKNLKMPWNNRISISTGALFEHQHSSARPRSGSKSSSAGEGSGKPPVPSASVGATHKKKTNLKHRDKSSEKKAITALSRDYHGAGVSATGTTEESGSFSEGIEMKRPLDPLEDLCKHLDDLGISGERKRKKREMLKKSKAEFDEMQAVAKNAKQQEDDEERCLKAIMDMADGKCETCQMRGEPSNS